MNDNELMNRRRFFKKTAKEMLPMLGAFVAAPTVIMNTLTSCSKGDGCNGCEAACQDNCIGSCKTDCTSTCKGTSKTTTCSNCANDCSNACKEGCQGSCKDSCKDGCQEGCQEGCKDGCKTTCSATCEGSATGKPTTGYIDNHEYVDLGLSVLWATCNLGASDKNSAGDFYLFGNKKYRESMQDKEIKDHLAMMLTVSETHNTICGTSYDAARQNWGSKWRMPSSDELDELINLCTKEKLEKTLKLTSKITGATIEFPYANFIRFWGEIQDCRYKADYKYGRYWTGTIPYSSYAHLFYFDDGPYGDQFYGIFEQSLNTWIIPIRPVAEREQSDRCNASCTANCSSDCKDTCKGECYWGCSSTCTKGCSGNCSGNCSGQCGNNCSGGCSETCTTACAKSCGTGCTTNCTGNCSGGCTSDCSGNCSDYCSQHCSNGCSSNCGKACEDTCTGGCYGQCYSTCGGTCSSGCVSSCDSSCKSYSKNGCSGCSNTCSYSCTKTCSSACYRNSH